MGRGDGPPTLTPSDAEVAAAEDSTRLLLARFGEPAAVEAPQGLEARVIAALPQARRPLRPLRRRAAAWAATAMVALLLALGVWGLAGSGPAPVAGQPPSALDRLTLTLALAAQPIVDQLADIGPAVALSALALGVGVGVWVWLWWRRSRDRHER
ncbi:MAG: hypothetical protein HGA45_27205 [Chloroflexales bacterium]|nr:hypothetical protein [Chloroflexales bacterium]